MSIDVTIKKNQILASSGELNSHYVLKNANIVNVFTKEILYGDIAIQNGMIVGIGKYKGDTELDLKGQYVCPGLIDAHVHIESTMVTPAGFAKTVMPCGTTTVIADPHEIANVSGLKGIEFMINQSENLPLHIYFMLPSCVPAASFENNGAKLMAADLKSLIDHPLVLGLGEVMDYPAVISAEEYILDKIVLAKTKVIDGHSPLLTGTSLNAYRVAGVDTDHECSTPQEAIERLRMGMYVQLREASAAHNVEAILKGLLESNIPLERCVFCTDDRHLDDILSLGHMDHIIRKAIRIGLNPVDAISMATIQTANCYGLKTKGAIAPGYDADLLILKDLENFQVKDVMANGQWVVQNGKVKEELFKNPDFDDQVANTVNMPVVTQEDFQISLKGNRANIIQLIPGQIETNKVVRDVDVTHGTYVHNPDKSICKIAVIERHKNLGNIGLGLIEGMGFKGGAISQSIAHDSHNVVVLGDNDTDMAIAANYIKTLQGGIVVVSNGHIIEELALPIAGLMSDKDPEYVMNKVKELIQHARKMGVPDNIDPFLTLGFMPLPVIPNIRITDQGLFDSRAFKFITIEGE